MQGAGAVAGTVSWAAFSSVLPSGRAVMFSTVLADEVSLTPSLSVLHMPGISPVLLLWGAGAGALTAEQTRLIQWLALPPLVLHQCWAFTPNASGTGELSRHSVSYISFSTFPGKRLSM